MGSDGRNAYLTRVRDQTITITHPCHPLQGQKLAVLQLHLKAEPQAVIVEVPDGNVQTIPLSWTDRATPDAHRVDASAKHGRLSGLALLELIDLMAAWRRET